MTAPAMAAPPPPAAAAMRPPKAAPPNAPMDALGLSSTVAQPVAPTTRSMITATIWNNDRDIEPSLSSPLGVEWPPSPLGAGAL